MDYVKILKRALEITWRHKALWLFGFLMALFSGGGGAGGGQGAQYVMDPGYRVEPALVLALVFVVLLIVLVLVAVGIIISYLSRGALIGMVREVEETGDTSVRSGWRIGWSRFLPLFAIDLAIGVPAAIVAILLIALALSPLLLLVAQRDVVSVLGILLTVLAMVLVIGLLIIMGVALSLLRELAHRQCVLEKKGVWDCIRDGYLMGRENLRHVGVTWLLLFGINLVIGVVSVPLFVVLFIAAAAPGILTYLTTDAVTPALVVGIPLLLLAFLLTTLLGAVYQVFHSAVWTLAYLEL
jgi:hypothetical protein